MRQGVQFQPPRQRDRTTVSRHAAINGAMGGFVFGCLFEWMYDGFASGRAAFIYIGAFALGGAILCVLVDKLLEFK